MAVAFDVVNECCVLQNFETALMKASANGHADVVEVLEAATATEEAVAVGAATKGEEGSSDGEDSTEEDRSSDGEGSTEEEGSSDEEGSTDEEVSTEVKQKKKKKKKKKKATNEAAEVASIIPIPDAEIVVRVSKRAIESLEEYNANPPIQQAYALACGALWGIVDLANGSAAYESGCNVTSEAKWRQGMHITFHRHIDNKHAQASDVHSVVTPHKVCSGIKQVVDSDKAVYAEVPLIEPHDVVVLNQGLLEACALFHEMAICIGDADGYCLRVVFDEMRRRLSDFGMSYDEVEKLLFELEEDGNGTIDETEWKRGYNSLPREALGLAPEPEIVAVIRGLGTAEEFAMYAQTCIDDGLTAELLQEYYEEDKTLLNLLEDLEIKKRPHQKAVFAKMKILLQVDEAKAQIRGSILAAMRIAIMSAGASKDFRKYAKKCAANGMDTMEVLRSYYQDDPQLGTFLEDLGVEKRIHKKAILAQLKTLLGVGEAGQQTPAQRSETLGVSASYVSKRFKKEAKAAGRELHEDQGDKYDLEFPVENPDNPNFYQLAPIMAHGESAVGFDKDCPRDGLKGCSIVGKCVSAGCCAD